MQRSVSGLRFIYSKGEPRNTRNTRKGSELRCIVLFQGFRVFRVFRGFKNSPITLAHYEIERAEDRDDVGDQIADTDFRKDGKIAERRRSNLQPIRHAAALAHDVETQNALRILRLEIDFTR